MKKDSSKVKECTCTQEAEDEYPEGQHKVDGKCVDKEPKQEEKKTEPTNEPIPPKAEEKTEQSTEGWYPNKDEINAKLKEFKQTLDELKQRVNNPTQLNELKQMEQQPQKSNYSITRISPEGTSFTQQDLKVLAEELKGSLKKYGFYSFDIDMSPKIVESMTKPYQIEEALSFSGDQSAKIPAMRDVAILPGGKYAKSIRDLVKFVEIPEGADSAKLYKADIPNAANLTEGSDNAFGTHTVTTVTIDADTIQGVPQEIKFSDIEDSPFEIMSYLAQTARMESLEREATLVFDTEAEAATPGKWIKGSDGSVITTDDAASVAFDPKGISGGLEHLETEEYDTSFGNVYCMMHPKQLRELREDADLVRWVQQGDANITRTGRLTHLYGVELRPTTAIKKFTAQTNAAHRAVMGIKGHTFALASKREVQIELERRARRLTVDWTWSQRKNSKAFDATSFVRISTTA